MNGLRAGAAARGIAVAVDSDDLLGLFLEQEGLCALTGIELRWQDRGRTPKGRKAHLRPSVDRIDSDRNYVLGNIQIVMSAVNTMKGELPQDVFFELCDVIASRRVLKS